jgi:acyl-CoA oxidase
MCCIDKTMVGWNLERVATICRERCGGQGYLSVNKFSELIGSAHSAMTAEGDNRVLMVKICKDMITNILQKGHKLPAMTLCPMRQLPQMTDVSSIETLKELFIFREIKLFETLLAK